MDLENLKKELESKTDFQIIEQITELTRKIDLMQRVLFFKLLEKDFEMRYEGKPIEHK